MSTRIQQWKQFFESKLPITITVVGKDDDNHEVLTEFGIISHSEYGCIHNYNKIIVVVHYEKQGLKTLFHEVHHHLYYKGVLKEPPKEEKYQPSKAWLFRYPKQERHEEQIVESTAQWAIDFEETGEVNKAYKEWLKDTIQKLF